jgi:NADH:ubiquinone oxidoreductase subunit 6 (subunit J)
MVVTLRNIFHSALFLVATFFFVAGIYLMLNAEFLAVVQVLIYVGAVTILILFAIMLTQQIQSKSVRQVNEQVIPALIFTVLFFVLAAITIDKTFGDVKPASNNNGAWTASFELINLPSEDSNWSWTAVLEDTTGNRYDASGSFALGDDNISRPAPKSLINNGFIISEKPDFSTITKTYKSDQTIYFKLWSDEVDYSIISKAQLMLANIPSAGQDSTEWKMIPENTEDSALTIKLANSNTETIGRLFMSKYVLPFEVVSVLLLAALIGAIVIARKDN